MLPGSAWPPLEVVAPAVVLLHDAIDGSARQHAAFRSLLLAGEQALRALPPVPLAPQDWRCLRHNNKKHDTSNMTKKRSRRRRGMYRLPRPAPRRRVSATGAAARAPRATGLEALTA